MVTNSNFNFRKNTSIILELPFSEHITELRQRTLFLFIGIISLTIISFLEVKSIVKILEYPINNVRFFQNSPGEYFISTIKISFYAGLLFTGPITIIQIILFLLALGVLQEVMEEEMFQDILIFLALFNG